MQSASIQQDSDGIRVQDGNVCCVTTGGMHFGIPIGDINWELDEITVDVDGETINLQLRDNATISQPNNTSQPNTVFSWNDSTTKLFLTIYKEMYGLFTSRKIPTKKELWHKIAIEMMKYGYNVTVVQAENKYKSLERSYKNMIKNNNKTGRGRMTCPYQEELTDILGSRHNIIPLVVSGNDGLVLREETEQKISSPINTDNIVDMTEPGSSQQNIGSNINNLPHTTSNNNQNQNSSTNSNINNLPHTTSNNNQNHNSSTNSTTNITENSSNNNSTRGKCNNRKRQLGTTAKCLLHCQKSMDKIASENSRKATIQEEIKQEYKKIRIAHEELVEQSVRANVLREERNELLKEIVKSFGKENRSN